MMQGPSTPGSEVPNRIIVFSWLVVCTEAVISAAVRLSTRSDVDRQNFGTTVTVRSRCAVPGPLCIVDRWSAGGVPSRSPALAVSRYRAASSC